MRKRIAVILLFAMFLIMAITACGSSSSPIEKVEPTLPKAEKKVVKTYKFELGADKNSEIPEVFEEDGYKYVLTDMVSTEIFSEDVQEISIEKSMTSSSDVHADSFEKMLEHEQDGYVGTLTRDDDTFMISATGFKNISRIVTETKMYNNLPRNDMSVISKSLNGLNLVSATWYDQNTRQRVSEFTNGTPGPYSVTARYQGVRIIKVATGYAAKIMYTGLVTKKVASGIETAVTYTGTPIVLDNKN